MSGVRVGTTFRARLVLIVALGLALTSPSLIAEPPAIGDTAPDFDLPGSDANRHHLSDYRGKFVVLAWFSRAYTGGSTAECVSLRDSSAAISKFDVALFMISVDEIRISTNFARRCKANFPILSDPGKATARAYGVLGSYNYATRWTVYIDPDGTIATIDKDVRPRDAGAVIARTLDELGVAAAASSE